MKNKLTYNKLQTPKAFPVAILFFSLFLFACGGSKLKEATLPPQAWVGTWNTAPQLVEPRNMPPAPGISHNTLRQIVRVSLGGDSLRVRFSNEFSSSPVTIKEANIALALGGNTIDTTSIKTLKFSGDNEVTMEPGTALNSDPFQFNLEPQADVAITIFFDETSQTVTGHPGSRTTSYIVSGNKASAANFTEATQADRWYVINGIDVKAPETAAAIVVLGNSITDGRGSGTNKQNRWTNILSERLQKNAATKQVAVLNQGIGGNCVLKYCLGPSALDRFQRDVIDQAGVSWLIILEGVNDIGQTPNVDEASKVAEDLIAAYEQMIHDAHNAGIKVYGATITPFGNSFYYTEFHETARNKVNEWIRNSGSFDAVIDFDLALRNPDDILNLLPDADTGDHLHPNETGYVMMGEAVDLSLFE